MSRAALDLFAGAGGWDVGARALGHWGRIDRVENWAPANATAEVAGFGKPVHEDVRTFSAPRGTYDLVIASPSCKKFSMAGDGTGRSQRDLIIERVRWLGAGWTSMMPNPDDLSLDPDAALTLEPLRIILECEPRAVALEQAPSVLPIWQAYADVLRARGYAVWTGVVDAADFGVPQHRKRAVLLARNDTTILPIPRETHYLAGPEPRHVSMAEALGWGMTARPSMTVTGGGSYTGGAEPWGNAARKGMRREYEADHWLGEWRERPTSEEAAALQTFPDGYPFQGGKGQRFQQIGNAVPPRLAEALLRVLI